MPATNDLSTFETDRQDLAAAFGSMSALRMPRRASILARNNPEQFDPERYKHVPRATRSKTPMQPDRICQSLSDFTIFNVADVCKAGLSDIGFGTVLGLPTASRCPSAITPGSLRSPSITRSCPGEQLAIHVFEDFLRVEFVNLQLLNSGQVTIGRNAVISDEIGFIRST